MLWKNQKSIREGEGGGRTAALREKQEKEENQGRFYL